MKGGSATDFPEEHRNAMLKELVGRFGVTYLEVAEEASGTASIEYKNSEECAWTKGADDIYRCQQRPGERCKSGACRGITVTFTDENGAIKRQLL